MTKKVEKKGRIAKIGWFYEYEASKEYRRIYDYELTDARYILGQRFTAKKPKEKILICIGINPSMAIPGHLDPTLQRVKKYAEDNKGYNAWYMLNVYPQRATEPDDMHLDTEYDKELHEANLSAIESLLSDLGEVKIDVWCAWGVSIKEREYLSRCLFGDERTKGIISLFNEKHTFKASGKTKEGHPGHPLVKRSADKLKELSRIRGLEELSERINGSKTESNKN